MECNFDEVVDRFGTDSEKIEGVKNLWGRDDLLPMWVADMDFRSPPFIVDAIRQRLDRDVLGYTCKSGSWYTSIINWVKARYGWDITREMLNFSPGIVPGLAMAVQRFTKPGDKVMVQPPVYHPFFLVAQRNEREVVYNPLILEDGRFRMNMELFREQIKDCKLFLLCNPHNPGGRVWTKEELQEVARICHEHKVLVVSDEIHADITFHPHVHHPFASVSEEARMNSIVLMSPSKAFNMPGLASSYVIIPNPEIRKMYERQIAANSLFDGHVFAYISVAAAYSNGTGWLNRMLDYVSANVDYLEKYLAEHMPGIRMVRPQATFLVFLDCRDLGLSQKELTGFFEDGAHLALNNGTMFGEGGEGFMRMNIACPRSTLIRALNQLEEAYENLTIQP